MPGVEQRLVELAEGVLIEEDTLGVIRQIMEYDERLRVKYLRPGAGDITDAPYAIFELCPDGKERLVFTVWELDQRVMERLYLADTQKHDIIARIDGANQRARRDSQRRFRDSMEEAADIAAHVIRSPKTEYTIPANRDNVEEPEVTVIHSHQPARTVPVRKK